MFNPVGVALFVTLLALSLAVSPWFFIGVGAQLVLSAL